MNPPLFDSHNHLQDERLRPHLSAVLEETRRRNVRKMVVNGSTEKDWFDVLRLANDHAEIIPSLGLHPWYVKQRSAEWQKTLVAYLDRRLVGIGEIGLDRWIEGYDLDDQSEVFLWQLHLAAERNLPVSIHCLQAWGKLLEILRSNSRPACGFVLHSFGGPRKMIAPLAELGAYFSLPGYFAHPRKSRQREAFRDVPLDRLLLETDAPDQLLPESYNLYSLSDESTGRPINHPANLIAIYQFAAELLGRPIEELAHRIEDNFQRLFGRMLD